MAAPGPCVAVAGAGTAAAALACLLRRSGVDVVLLVRGRPSPVPPVVEALPEATVRLLAEAGLAPALAAAGAVVVRGFDNATGPQVHRLDGWWTHVDPARLAAEAVRAAVRLGATVLPGDAGGVPMPVPGGLEVRAGGRCLRVAAAVDATGRAARWSRPVVRHGHDSATQGPLSGTADSRPERLARTADGWAYRLDHPAAAVVGVVGASPTARPARLDPAVATALEVARPDRFVRVAVRPAAVRWARNPVGPRRLAIGDAALAMSPVAGQGLRFAVASAFAAATVVRTWLADGGAGAGHDDQDDDAADYYRAFVDGVRARHLATLRTDPTGEGPAAVALDPAGRLHWAATTRRAGMPVDGRIVAGECCVLPDGGLVRTVGGVDLLTLRAAVDEGRTPDALHARLVAAAVAPASARTLVAWALRHGVLR